MVWLIRRSHKIDTIFHCIVVESVNTTISGSDVHIQAIANNFEASPTIDAVFMLHHLYSIECGRFLVICRFVKMVNDFRP